MSFRNFVNSGVLVGILLRGIVPADAQQANTAIVVGTVDDATASPLPGATVTLTHLATNAVTEVVTDERGQYRTPPLRIGEYVIAITLTGFRRFSQQGVVLNLGDVRKVDARLALGELAEEVTVRGTAPLLNTVDSTVGTVITNQQIKDLPLNGRDYLQLASLTAGTVPSQQGVGIGGQAGTQAAFLLDGQDNNNQQIARRLGGQPGARPAVAPSVPSQRANGTRTAPAVCP